MSIEQKREALEWGRFAEARAWLEIERKFGSQVRLLESNFRARGGEVDLIYEETAEGCKVLVFVEVRGRRTASLAEPIEFADRRKWRRFERAVRTYLARYQGSAEEVRCDLWSWDRDRWRDFRGIWPSREGA